MGPAGTTVRPLRTEGRFIAGPRASREARAETLRVGRGAGSPATGVGPTRAMRGGLAVGGRSVGACSIQLHLLSHSTSNVFSAA